MSEKSEKCLKKKKYDSKYKSEWASEEHMMEMKKLEESSVLNISENGRKSQIWHSQLKIKQIPEGPGPLSILGCFATSGKSCIYLSLF